MSSGLIHRPVPPEVNGITVSLESKEERDVAAVACVLAPVIVERPKSDMQARRSLSIRMLALKKGIQSQAGMRHGITTYPLQISVDEMKPMHIRQTLRNVDELNMPVRD